MIADPHEGPRTGATDTTGPRGTYGCACVSDSARMCTLLRYPERDVCDSDDNCECMCHQWREDDDDN